MNKVTLWALVLATPLLTAGCATKNPFKTAFFKSDKTTKQAVVEAQSVESSQVAAVQVDAPVTTSDDPEALYQYGYKRFYGIGMNYDEQNGIDLLEQSAQMGHQKAKQLLSRLAEMGYAVSPDVLAGKQRPIAATVANQQKTMARETVIQPEIVTNQDWYYSEPNKNDQASVPKPSLDLLNAENERPITKAKASHKLSGDEQALLNMDQSLYTLQLVAAKDKEGLDMFIANNGLYNKVRVVKKRVSGQDWFVALYGQFNSKAAADSAAQNLSQQLYPSITPWIRPVRSIQDEVNSQIG